MRWLGLFGIVLLGVFSPIVYASMPTTTTYMLQSYGFGSGGTANSSTSTYALEGITGEISGQPSNTTTYSTLPGFIQTQQANVPKLSALDNGSGIYYNKLHFTIDKQNNPTDALYALQISTTSDFSSNVNYVKSDFTIGSTLATTDYQNYAAFGGSSGTYIIGLTPGTTYYVRVKAAQHLFSQTGGRYTETGYGPSSNAATASQSITFNLVTSNQASPPFSIDLGNLPAGTPVTSSQTINVTLSTNAVSGGDVYISGSNSGLNSAATGYTITSATADLSSAAQGFGAQSNSITQGSLGALSVADSIYSGSGSNVGIVNTTVRSIYTATAPITGPTGKIQLIGKSATMTEAATDYSDTLTLVASGNF